MPVLYVIKTQIGISSIKINIPTFNINIHIQGWFCYERDLLWKSLIYEFDGSVCLHSVPRNLFVSKLILNNRTILCFEPISLFVRVIVIAVKLSLTATTITSSNISSSFYLSHKTILIPLIQWKLTDIKT